MIYQLLMPKFGANIESGIIVEWLKKEGDSVEKNDILARAETSKAVFDIEAEESGVLRKILAVKGQEVSANHAIAIVTDKNEDISNVLAEISKQKVDRSAEYVKKMDESVFAVERILAGKEQRKMTPAARRLMREKGVSEDLLSAMAKEVIEEKDIWALLNGEQVFIYGASTGAKQIMDILKSHGKYRVIGIIDDNPELLGKNVWGIEVVGNFEWLKKRYQENPDFVVMISSHSTNREKIYKRIKQDLPDLKLPPIVDSRTIFQSSVKIEESSLVEAGVILGHEVHIGRNTILNLGVKISHNTIVGDHCHLAIGSAVSAAVVIENNVFVGAGSAINPAVTIGENSIVSPGTAVLHDIPKDVIVSGVPGRIAGESRRGKQ